MKSIDNYFFSRHKKGYHSILLIPSIAGVFLFMVPIYYQGAIMVPIAVLVRITETLFHDVLPVILAVLINVSAIIALIIKVANPGFNSKNNLLKCILNPPQPEFIARQLSAILILTIYAKTGPLALNNQIVGSMLLNDILPVVFLSLIIAGFFMPLLISFGLPEFFGALSSGIMRPAFLLPKCATVNCIASWLGDGSVGILITSKLYEMGIYTKREAAVIGTTFSPVSITFSFVVISQVGLIQMFVPFYFTVCVAGLTAAIVVPRLPPLSKKKNQYIDDSQVKKRSEDVPADCNGWSFGIQQAIKKVFEIKDPHKMFMGNLTNVMALIVTVMPVILVTGTVGLLLVEYTPLFQYLGMPFVPFLRLLQIPEPVKASECIAIGFADMFLPSLLAATVENDLTRFFIATMSVTQIIYVSESGALLMASKIPISFSELFAIFILRTLVTLPVIALMAHIFF